MRRDTRILLLRLFLVLSCIACSRCYTTITAAPPFCRGNQHQTSVVVSKGEGLCAVSRAHILKGAIFSVLPLLLRGKAGFATESVSEVGEQRTVFVAGATGRTGKEVVQVLREQKYSVKAGVRSSTLASKAGLKQLPGVEPVLFDVTNPASLEAAMRGVDCVICTIGFVPTYDAGEDRRLAQAIDADGTIALIDAAKKANVSKFVLVSSLLTGLHNTPQQESNLNYRALNLLGGVLDAKAQAEAALRASGLDAVIVRPGVLAARQQGSLLFGAPQSFTGQPDPLPPSSFSSSSSSSAAASSSASRAGAASGGGQRRRVRCESPFMAAAGAVCAVTRRQVAQVCVRALREPLPPQFNGVLEIVARPDAPPLPSESSSDAWFRLE